MPTLKQVDRAKITLYMDKRYTSLDDRDKARKVIQDRIDELNKFISDFPNTPLQDGFEGQINELNKVLNNTKEI